MIIATILKIAALMCGVVLLGRLLRQRPLPADVSSAADTLPSTDLSRAVLASAQRVLSEQQYDFLPFFRLEYPEEPERMNAQQRHWAQESIALLQQQDLTLLPQVVEYAARLKQEYPAFYFGYYAAALVRQRQGDFESACREVEEGIPRCHQKYTLYAALGSLLYDHGDVNPALGWWIRSVVSQASVRTLGLSVPFVLLGYAARHRNLTKIAEALFEVARQIDSKPPLLNEAAQEKLRAQLRDKAADTLHQALVLLYTEYLTALRA